MSHLRKQEKFAACSRIFKCELWSQTPLKYSSKIAAASVPKYVLMCSEYYNSVIILQINRLHRLP